MQECTQPAGFSHCSHTPSLPFPIPFPPPNSAHVFSLVPIWSTLIKALYLKHLHLRLFQHLYLALISTPSFYWSSVKSGRAHENYFYLEVLATCKVRIFSRYKNKYLCSIFFYVGNLGNCYKTLFSESDNSTQPLLYSISFPVHMRG